MRSTYPGFLYIDFNGLTFDVVLFGEILESFDKEEDAKVFYAKIAEAYDSAKAEEPTIQEYLATWIEDEDTGKQIASRLADLGVTSFKVIQHGKGNGVSIRYNFTATENEMLQWRELLKSLDLDPFYVVVA